MKKQRIAIIGAGLSGLVLAHRLHPHAEVKVFDKARGVGGRMSTRHHEKLSFDHGAQFFIAKTPSFLRFMEEHLQDVVDVWHARFAEITGNVITGERLWDESYPHFLGSPGMSAICRHLAKSLDVQLNVWVSTIHRKNRQWDVYDAQSHCLGKFDWVLFAIPPHQAYTIMPECFSYRSIINDVNMLPCYSLMLSYAAAFDLDWDVALIKNNNISWISQNSTKPMRKKNEQTFVVLSTNLWAKQHLENSFEWVSQRLKQAFDDVCKTHGTEPSTQLLHRWRYANIKKQHSLPYYIDDEHRLAVCGDWCHQGRVESAFLSGHALSQQVLSTI